MLFDWVFFDCKSRIFFQIKRDVATVLFMFMLSFLFVIICGLFVIICGLFVIICGLL
jgi:hypothetical protein